MNYTIQQRLTFLTILICYVLFHNVTIVGYIFGIDCQTTLQVQEKFISRFPSKFMYSHVVLVVSRYWTSCPDTGQHRSTAKILISPWKQRQKS